MIPAHDCADWAAGCCPCDYELRTDEYGQPRCSEPEVEHGRLRACGDCPECRYIAEAA